MHHFVIDRHRQAEEAQDVWTPSLSSQGPDSYGGFDVLNIYCATAAMVRFPYLYVLRFTVRMQATLKEAYVEYSSESNVKMPVSVLV